MKSTVARDEIYQSMDAISLGMDVKEILFQLQRSTAGHIDRINKVIEKGRSYNNKLEKYTRHVA